MANPFKKKDSDVSGSKSLQKNDNERLKQEIMDLKRQHTEETNEFEKKHAEVISKLENEEIKNMQLLLRYTIIFLRRWLLVYML